MGELFLEFMRASIQGSVLIAAVCLLRLVLKKAPRNAICLLWLLAGLRLLVPFEIESKLSLQPRVEPVALEQPVTVVVPENIALMLEDEPPQEVDIPDVDAAEPEMEQTSVLYAVEDGTVRRLNTADILSWVWMVVALAMGGYSLISYLSLKRRVASGVIFAEGIWFCPGLDTAFVLGFFRPQIYLPTGISDAEQAFVLAHERCHIRRFDHWWKLLGFAALAVHWFNPLVWVAYVLLCRDLEMACDEAVIRNLSLGDRKAYSQALISCAAQHRSIAACPVAFGEVSVMGRIKNVMNYKKPKFWIILVAVIAIVLAVACFLTSPKQELMEVKIPSQSYEMSDRTYTVREKFADSTAFAGSTCDYESDYAIYHFNSDIMQEERDTCVFYSDGILSRLKLAEKPEFVVLDNYNGAWIGGKYLYIGGDFATIDYGAKLITLICGGYANYGAAYGYADYIAVEDGWKEATDWQSDLTNNDARDLNWLCFREGFVSDGEIAINRNTAIRFAREYIAENGEAAYQQLILKSGDVDDVAEFNEVLSGWYADNGLYYTPTEVLYSMGGEYHDYLAKCAYATFYLPEDWETRFYSNLTMNKGFLHENYADVKSCFETNAYQMGQLQEIVGVDGNGDLLAVEFKSEGMSTAEPPLGIRINSIEDLPMLYVTVLTYDLQRAGLAYNLAPAMADYISVSGPNLYRGEWLRYCARNGMQASGYQRGDWNELFVEMMEDETDPAVIQRTRWDFGSYCSEDYYDKSGSGVVMSFGWYLIDKYGYETMFDFIHETGNKPIEIDLAQERNHWIAYLEEKYGAYPKYIDGESFETKQDDPVCTDASCTNTSHDHSGIHCTDTNCTNMTHNHYGIACTVEHCDNPAHGHRNHNDN